MTFLSYVAGAIDPNEGRGVGIVIRDILTDGRNQLGNAYEHAGSAAAWFSATEGALDHIQAGR